MHARTLHSQSDERSCHGNIPRVKFAPIFLTPSDRLPCASHSSSPSRTRKGIRAPRRSRARRCRAVGNSAIPPRTDLPLPGRSVAPIFRGSRRPRTQPRGRFRLARRQRIRGKTAKKTSSRTPRSIADAGDEPSRRPTTLRPDASARAARARKKTIGALAPERIAAWRQAAIGSTRRNAPQRRRFATGPVRAALPWRMPRCVEGLQPREVAQR